MTGPLEAYVTWYERRTVGVKVLVGKPTGKKVAIVGAGPSGLACTEQLLQKGHDVTVVEGKPAPGGLLVYGIPPFKIPKEIVFCRVGDMQEAGAKFSFNTLVGKDITIDHLFEKGFEAVFVGGGSNVEAPMEVPGKDLPGVYKATEFLARSNVDMELLPKEWRSRPEVGEKVAGLWGGESGSA